MFIAYEAIAKMNSRIAYCSLSGHGQDEPCQNRMAYNINNDQAKVKQVRVGVKLADILIKTRGLVLFLGQHTDGLQKEIEYSEKQVQELRQVRTTA